MTHRVHTILSILAEDHAPVALRPSLLLAIDWPTVAEEAPASEGDDHAATLVALRLRGAITDGHPAIASLAARLATVAASLTNTGDKAMAAHAAALWGAAAALVGFRVASLDATANVDPSTAEAYLRALARKANGIMFGMSRTPAEQAAIVGTVLDKVKAHEFSDREELRASHERLKDALTALATKAADIVPGVIAAGPAEKATLIATALDRVTHWRSMVQARDAALGDLGWDGAENLQAWTARHKAEHDAANDGNKFARGLLKTCAEEAAKHTGETVTIYAAEQAGVIGAAIRKLAAERDTSTSEAHSARVTLANVQSFLDKAERGREALRTERDHLRAQVDRMVAAMRVKPRPQPGDVVPWAEVEGGALYARTSSMFPFRAVVGPRHVTLAGPDDRDLSRLLAGGFGNHADELRKRTEGSDSVLVARDLGTDPEAWRKAMREWTASESSRPR